MKNERERGRERRKAKSGRGIRRAGVFSLVLFDLAPSCHVVSR